MATWHIVYRGENTMGDIYCRLIPRMGPVWDYRGEATEFTDRDWLEHILKYMQDADPGNAADMVIEEV